MMAWLLTCHQSTTPESTLAIKLFVLEAAAPGVPWITRPMFSASLCRRVSFRQLVSVA
jgi:hypothetical protein